MGTYLATGIVYKMSIQKRHIENKNLKIENIQLALQKEVDLQHYSFEESEDTVFWIIKPKILEGNLAEFLEAQFKMYDSTTMDIKEIISNVKTAKTGEEVIKLAQSHSIENFQMVGYIEDYPRVLKENGFTEHVPVNYELIAFFMDGKIIMECYGNIFHYFERNIRLQNEKYPVATCVKVMISG